ncbi:H/ACA ribonucleoprotein complex subunit 1 [Ceratina calcarata]|uniref:H/ACA ribonucleoprotein complex subunit n=1 Tax=Ceratina calcarata TaxID=156304 RepID=A0AAJ7IZ53_9HYME|nr:H/ACA ribonucleoprotein complex subunit 1 [Ceratina calcarata]
MSFRGRGGGGGFGRGRRDGRGFRGGRGGGDRGSRGFDQGPPERVTPLGRFTWTVQDDLVAKVEIEQIPFFNAPIYTEAKRQIGKIDEIFGNIRDYYVSIKLSENVKAASFQKDVQLFIDPAKLLPLQRFLPKPPGSKVQKRGRGDGGGRGRGSRGGPGGGRGRGGDGRPPSFGRGHGGFGNRGGGFGNRGGGGGFRGRGFGRSDGGRGRK